MLIIIWSLFLLGGDLDRLYTKWTGVGPLEPIPDALLMELIMSTRDFGSLGVGQKVLVADNASNRVVL